MARTTVKDVRAAFERFARLASFTLAEGEWFQLEEGSQTNGRAWRLYVRKPEGSGLYNPKGISDYLGWSAAEAEARLHALSDGISLVAEHLERGAS